MIGRAARCLAALPLLLPLACEGVDRTPARDAAPPTTDAPAAAAAGTLGGSVRVVPADAPCVPAPARSAPCPAVDPPAGTVLALEGERRIAVRLEANGDWSVEHPGAGAYSVVVRAPDGTSARESVGLGAADRLLLVRVHEGFTALDVEPVG